MLPHPQYNIHFYRYGQIVVGPCGSGKTTYCDGMQQYLQLLGRNAVVVNLDPANNHSDDDDAAALNHPSNDIHTGRHPNTALPYTAIYDVCVEAVNLKSVMKQMQLGPNGALIYCMEYMDLHADEIIETILSRCTDENNAYFIFDFPGQVELYTHSTRVQSLLQKLTTKFQMKLTVVQLIDALYCTDVTKFISAALLGTTTMLRLELPTVNVLSKVDLLSSYGTLPLQLDYYTECYDLERLIPFLHQTNIPNDESIDPTVEDDEYEIADDPEYRRILQKRQTSKFAVSYEKLHRALAEVVEDYSLLSFVPLDITNAESVGRVLANIDKCNGYIYSSTTTATTDHQHHRPNTRTTTTNVVHQNLFQCAVQHDGHNNRYESLADVRERIASPESIRELRKKKK